MDKKFIAFVLLLCTARAATAQSPQLWGLSFQGGPGNFGTVMKINGDATGFNSFGLHAASGFSPAGRMVLEKNNRFYGMSFAGGAFGSGSFFSFNPQDSAYTDLIDFNKTGNYNVLSELAPDGDSMIYGILYEGGPLFKGAIFSFNYLTGYYNMVYQVTDTTMGANPRSITWAQNNKLYGTTDSGGLHNLGCIFSLDPVTNTYAKLHDFDTANNSPCGSLVQADNGLLYGLTSAGGDNGWGIIYSIDTSTGELIKRYDFLFADGAPYYNNALIKANNHQLYGMASNGGTSNWGTIFSFDPTAETFAKLYNLDSVNGKWPAGSLMQASDGKLYGMTTNGGANNPQNEGDGVIFSFDYNNSSYIKLKDLSSETGINPYGSLAEYPGAAGMAQMNNAFTLHIYPNPAANQVIVLIPDEFINDRNVNISITNSTGQLIARQLANKTLMAFDISTLSAGIYYISGVNGAQTWQAKFVKE